MQRLVNRSLSWFLRESGSVRREQISKIFQIFWTLFARTDRNNTHGRNSSRSYAKDSLPLQTNHLAENSITMNLSDRIKKEFSAKCWPEGAISKSGRSTGYLNHRKRSSEKGPHLSVVLVHLPSRTRVSALKLLNSVMKYVSNLFPNRICNLFES